jgi:hypothetical protein
VHRGEPLGLLAERPPRRRVEPPERLELDPAALVAPLAGDRAVDEERRERIAPRSSSSWRASSARLSSRRVRVRMLRPASGWR